MTRPSSFVVTLHADLRPLVANLNRVLAKRGAAPVQKHELPDIDEMLYAALGNRAAEAARCSRCGGYASADSDGEDLLDSRRVEQEGERPATGLDLAQRPLRVLSEVESAPAVDP